MSRYVSIRGWLECDGEDIPGLKEIVNNYSKNWSKFGMTQEIRTLYQKGWRFPSDSINWTNYLFYGADLKSYFAEYIKDQLSTMATTNHEIEGVFYIDDEDREEKIIWKIDGGELIETAR